MLAHTFSHCAPGMSAHENGACLQTAFKKYKTICRSQRSGAQIIHVCAGTHTYTHVHTHAHRAQERRVENRQQKGPKGPEAQPERLLAFLLQGEKEQEKRAERLVD